MGVYRIHDAKLILHLFPLKHFYLQNAFNLHFKETK